MSHQGFSKVLESSSVTASCCGEFIEPGVTNLMVLKHDLLEVYTVVDSAASDSNAVLALEGAFPMTLSADCMEKARFPGHSLDSLLLAFSDAKISVMAWSHEENRLVTKSLHLLEDPEVQLEKTLANELSSKLILRVDPGGPGRASQCISLLAYDRFLFIIPFLGDDSWAAGATAAGEARFPLGKPATIDLHKKAHSLHGIRDVAFIHGSYIPVLMVLHELEPAWAGRLTLALGDRNPVIEHKRLTNALSSVSVHISPGDKIDVETSRVGSRIPYNSFALLPLKAAPYGALVLCPNVVMHLEKDERSGYGVHLNDYGRVELSSSEALQMPHGQAELREMDGQRIPIYAEVDEPDSGEIRLVTSFEDAVVMELPGHDTHSLVALASGDVCLLNVSRNKQNGNVSSINFTLCSGVATLPCVPRQPGSVNCPIPSTMCSWGDFVFIGSRTGDSVLLQKQALPSAHLNRLCTLLNTGPVVDSALGDSSVQPLDESGDREHFPAPSLGMSTVIPVNLKPVTDRSFAERHASMELVALTGKGRDGAVCVLNRTVKPLVLCEDKLNGNTCFSLRLPEGCGFTRKRKRDSEEGDYVAPEGMHDCLVVSTPTATKVLSVGKKLVERKQETPLLRDHPTVHAANVCGGAAVLQITTTHVLLFRAAHRVLKDIKSQLRADDSQPRIHQAVSAGRHCILLLTDGTLRHVTLSLDADSGTTDFEISTPVVDTSLSRGFVTSVSLQLTHLLDTWLAPPPAGAGESEAKPLLTVTWTSGAVQLLNVEDWSDVLMLDNLVEFPEYADAAEGAASPVWSDLGPGVPKGEHLIGAYVGRVESSDRHPHLFLLTNADTLVAYRGFKHQGVLRWRKVLQNVHRPAEAMQHLTAPPRLAPTDPSLRIDVSRDEAGVVVGIFPATPAAVRITPFDNIFGNEGVFIRHVASAAWAFSERGLLRVHQMAHPDPIRCMAPLNSPCAPAGFALVTGRSLSLLLLTWHKRMNFKAPWPTRKILLRRTPHKIVFDGNLRTYTIVVSDEKPFKPAKTEFDAEADAFLTDNEAESRMKEVSPHEGIPIPTNGAYELLLYSAFSWRPFAGINLKENEKVLSFESLVLKRQEYDRSRRYTDSTHVQVCGTGFPIAEDVPCRGRIIIMKVRVGRTRQDRVLEVDCELPTQGPVTAITSQDGYIFAAVAARIHVFNYDWHKKELQLVAWCDARFYTQSLVAFKGFLLAGDLFDSVSLLRWTEAGNSLTIVARDSNKIPCTGCDFSVDHASVGMVMGDDNGNLSVMQYDPAASSKVLQTVSDINISTTLQRLLRLRTLKVPLQGSDPGPVAPGARTAVIFGTKHGAICTLQPVAEHVHRDLHWLHAKVVTEVEHFAGLHPRASRKFRGRRFRKPDPKNRRSVVTDLEVLYRFLELPKSHQQELVSAANLSSCDQVIAMLRALQQETQYL